MPHLPGPPPELVATPRPTTLFGWPPGVAPEPGRWAVLGVPADGLATERRGAADGPAALRNASCRLGTSRVLGVEDDRRGTGVDLGDVEVNRFQPQESFTPVRLAVESVAAAGAVPLLLGGDHSLTYPAVSAVAAHHGSLRLLQLDAHHDATDPLEWNCRFNHGTFLRNLVEDGTIAGEDVLQVGVRNFQWSASGGRFVNRHGVRVVPPGNRMTEEVGRWLQASTGRPLYVTIDIDAVDPAFAPGTGEPMVGGLSSREVLELVSVVAGFAAAGSCRLVGADLVEVVPLLDEGERTLFLAAHLLASLVAGLPRETSLGT